MTRSGWTFEWAHKDEAPGDPGIGEGNGVGLAGEARRRVRLLLVVVALVAGVAVADGLTGRAGTPGSTPSVVGEAVPSAEAESSAWFCVGGAGAGGGAPGRLVLTNPTARVVRGTVSSVATGGSGGTADVSVPAHGQTSVVPAQGASGSWEAATVLFDGGGVGVSETVVGPLGWSMAPCASATSSTWYFAHGSTASGAILSLSLYNPARADAVVDVTLDSASAGQVRPPAYQGIAVPAGSLVVENIGDHLLNDPSVATEVSTSSGTVVAAELQLTLNAGSAGASLLLGAGARETEWDFPQNSGAAAGSTVFHVFNPSDGEATVSANVNVPGGGKNGPISIRVPPHSVSDLVAHDEPRIPSSTSYAIEFAAEGGVGIVVDREVVSPPGSPVPQVGEVHGFPGGVRRVLLPAVIPPGIGAPDLAVSDLSSRPVTVTVESVVRGVPLAGLDHRVVQPGESLVATPEVAPQIGAVPLLVTASGPVAVELDGAPAGVAGAVIVPALVLG